MVGEYPDVGVSISGYGYDWSAIFVAPGSLRTIGDGFSASEQRVAQLLADGGDNVVLRAATGVGRTWDLLVNGVPYDVYTPTTGNIDRIVSAVLTSGDAQYAEAVVDVDTSSNWVGPAVRLNANGTQGYGVLARGGVNELRLYRINSGIATIIADGASAPVDGKTVRIEADGSTVNVFMDGVLEITWVDTSPFIGAQNRGVGILGLGGRADDFEAGVLVPPPAGSGTVADDFNRANTTSGLGASWVLRDPYDGSLVTSARISSNRVVVDPAWTMAVHETAATSDVQWAQTVVDVDGSTNWAGPAVRLNQNGSQGYAVLARGGVNELRLYRINSGLGVPVSVEAAGVPVDGKTVRIEATGGTVTVLLDGVVKITWTDPSPHMGTGYRRTGVLGNAGNFDDFAGSGPGTSSTSTVLLRFGGTLIGAARGGVVSLSVPDHLGSGTVERGVSGTVVQRYTPFGSLRSGTSNVLGLDQTFTGQTDDPGTGLIDFNARQYDPQLGRFIQADTVLDGLNRYSYVGNNPLNRVDPTGRYCEDASAIGIIIGCGPTGYGNTGAAEDARNRVAGVPTHWDDPEKSDAWGDYVAAVSDPYKVKGAEPRPDNCRGVLNCTADGMYNWAGVTSKVETGCSALFFTGVGLVCAKYASAATLGLHTIGTAATCAEAGTGDRQCRVNFAHLSLGAGASIFSSWMRVGQVPEMLPGVYLTEASFNVLMQIAVGAYWEPPDNRDPYD